jgi:alpha-1,3-glucosyltransferase
LIHLIKLGITVIISFTVLWSPFCIYDDSSSSCLSSLLQVLHRQFPFSRGIFEDKVANLWYCGSIVIDFRQYLSIEVMVKMSLVLTLLLLTPICINLLMAPLCPTRMLLALMNSALAFFLASFQVHEKSLLLVLVPASLLLNDDIVLISWIQVIGTFSMFPLLIRDGQRIPYVITIILFIVMIILYRSISQASSSSSSLSVPFSKWNSIKRIVVILSSIGMITLHTMEIFIVPPKR